MTFTDLLMLPFLAIAGLAVTALLTLAIGLIVRVHLSAGAGSAESVTRAVAEGSVPAETSNQERGQ